MRFYRGALVFVWFLACSSSVPAPATESASPPPTPVAPAEKVAPVLVNVAEPAPSPSSVESSVPRHADAAAASIPEERVDSDGLRTADLTIGNGPAVVKGATIVVHYEGRLQNGEVFDSSLTRGTPFEVAIGKGQVIQGWERGLLGMRVGGRRRLVIPPALGYGSRGSPPKIGPNATLIFDIELLALR